MNRSRHRALFLAALSASSLASTTFGVDRTWLNANFGTFTVASNWSGGVVPGPTDRAVFGLASPYSVSFPGSVATDRLLVTGERVSFSMNGHSYLLNNSVIDSLDVGSGSGNFSTLQLINGTLNASGGVSVGLTDAGGTLQLGTAGSALITPDNVLVGFRDSQSGDTGSGTVLVNSGGILSCGVCQIGFGLHGEGFGTVVFAGGVGTFGHALLGSGGSGTLIVNNFGDLTSGTLEVGAQNNGAAGTILLSGSGSSIAVTGALKLGNAFEASAGTVNIDNGGSMNVSGQTSIGAAGFGRMQLRNGSDFRTTSSLLVGELGHGELDIGTGAVVTCGNCSIGEDASAPGGSAVVDGPGSALNATSTISVGTNTVGVLSVSNGAIVRTGISSAFTIGALGSVTLDGGVISAGNFVRNASGQFAFNAGTLLLTGTTFDLTNDLINSGSPRLTAGHTVKSTGGLTVNTAPLVMDGGALLGTTLTVGLQGTLLLANPASNVSMSSVVTDNGLIRGNGAIGASAVIINASGELRAGATDQLTLTSPIVTNNGQINLFGGLISASGTLTNASTGRISGRGVLDAGTTGNSGTISLTSGISDVFGTVTNNSGARVIAAGNALATFYGPVTNAAGSNFQVSAGSTVVFLGNVSGLGAFTGTGIKDFQGGANVGASLDSGGDSIVGGNALLSATHVREHALVVDGRVVIPPNGTGAGTSRLNTLTIDGNTTPTGTLELNDNDLLVDYAAAGEPSPLPTMQAQIVFARHGGAWDRPGITSAAAATQVAHATTLGIMEGSSFRQIYGPTATFSGGQSVDDTSILVKYSWYGDSDFNGTVNFDDYVRIDNGFNNHLSGWVNGDFDLNGAVNFDDYVLIDLAFNTQSGTLGRALSFLDGSDRSDDGMSEPALRRARQHFEQFGSDYANHFLAAVPEPTGAAGVVAMSLHALRRRRRALRV